jgi:hypothetical protein
MRDFLAVPAVMPSASPASLRAPAPLQIIPRYLGSVARRRDDADRRGRRLSGFEKDFGSAGTESANRKKLRSPYSLDRDSSSLICAGSELEALGIRALRRSADQLDRQRDFGRVLKLWPRRLLGRQSDSQPHAAKKAGNGDRQIVHPDAGGPGIGHNSLRPLLLGEALRHSRHHYRAIWPGGRCSLRALRLLHVPAKHRCEPDRPDRRDRRSHFVSLCNACIRLFPDRPVDQCRNTCIRLSNADAIALTIQIGIPLSMILALAVASWGNINFVGLHRFYRDRLMEAFIPNKGGPSMFIGRQRFVAVSKAQSWFSLSASKPRPGKDL